MLRQKSLEWFLDWPRFTNDFNMFRVQEQYRQLVGERNFQLPNRYDDFTEHVAAMERALAWRPELTVPCNNDLLAGNFVDDGHQVWLIDYEYSGNNDPCFELGNIWSESDLPLPLLDLLIARYYGRPSRRLTARARLLAIMSKYGWTLWASIQASTSTLEFDFWEWGMEKYDRALAEFDGPSFDALLDEATRAD